MKDFLKNSLLRFTSKLVYRKLREATLSDLFEKKSKIMVLAPHPDDEIIGVGGIILEALTKQGQVHIVLLTDGESSGASSDKEQVKVERKKLTQNVISKLRLNENDITRLELEDGKVPHENDVGFDAIAQRIAKIMDEWKPDIVFATHEKDFWPFDHVACAQLAKEAVYQSESKPKLYFYWVWACYHLKPWKLSGLNFSGLKKIAIHSHIARKQELINDYLQAKAPSGTPWSGNLPTGMLRPFQKSYEIVEKYEQDKD